MSENRAVFKETAERLFADLVTPAMIEAAERRELPHALFDALHETGISAMLVPEESGGVGADVGDAVAILRLAGRHAAPGPILETILGNRLRARLGLEPVRAATLAFADTQGGLYGVAWPEAVDSLLLVHDQSIEAAHPAGFEVEPGRDTSGEPRDRLQRGQLGNGPSGEAGPALRTAAVLRAGQMLGAMDWALERSVDYAGERKQFGREIGKFQAIQQMLAELADHVLASAAITLAAGDADTDTLVAAARSRLADAVDATVTITHQVHGALGFSREYALNHRTRRLMAWRDDYGTTAMWRRALAKGFVGLDYAAFWPAIVDAAAIRAA